MRVNFQRRRNWPVFVGLRARIDSATLDAQVGKPRLRAPTTRRYWRAYRYNRCLRIYEAGLTSADELYRLYSEWVQGRATGWTLLGQEFPVSIWCGRSS